MASSHYGAHVYVQRFLGRRRIRYTHHGIYVGNGRFVHYAGLSDGSLRSGPIEEVDASTFSGGERIYVYQYPPGIDRYTPEETVARARSLVGEARYNLALRNCEHFANWAAIGVWYCGQVRVEGPRASDVSDIFGIDPLRGNVVLKPQHRLEEQGMGGLATIFDRPLETVHAVVVAVPPSQYGDPDEAPLEVGSHVLVDPSSPRYQVDTRSGHVWVMSVVDVLAMVNGSGAH